MIQNPILPGFYPDPSICRVGDDFYLVCSSFSFYPGVPIFHSRDLENWEQLGYVLDRPEQLPVGYGDLSGGIFAPSIRYHEGTFYMITTNMTMGFKNFIVTAKDPAGPWSEMHVIEDAEGIDPSLFFDDDGKAYYIGTLSMEHGEIYGQGIWGCEIDLDKMELKGEKKILWQGALKNAFFPEGPHIYKKDGWYYLMVAEGGTEHYHSITISRSKTVMGDYEGFMGNPICTHRHLGKNYPICNVGHGDLVELSDGSWYLVLLGSRLMDGYHKILGRETFLAPVVWEDGWPVVSVGTGKIEDEYPSVEALKTKEAVKKQCWNTDTDFEEKKLGMEWNFVGTPEKDSWKLEDSCLKIRMSEKGIRPKELNGVTENFEERLGVLAAMKGSLPFVGRRQQHMNFQAETTLNLDLKEGESAGLAVLQNNYNQLRLECRNNGTGKEAVCISTRVVRRDGCTWLEDTEEGKVSVTGEKLILGVEGEGTRYHFYCVINGEKKRIAENVSGAFLGSETSGGYIGAFIGMFACGDYQGEARYAAFDSFSYKGGKTE